MNLVIVIVDYNEVAANSLSKLLSLKGHTVGSVYEGRGVRDAVREHDPEVVCSILSCRI